MQSLAPGWHEWETTTRTGERVPIEWFNLRLSDDTLVGVGLDLRERRRSESRWRRLFGSHMMLQ